MDKIIEDLDLDVMNMADPDGHIPDVEEEVQPSRQPTTIKAVVKIGPTGNGKQVSFKEGQTVVSRMSPMAQEELKHAILSEYNRGQVGDSTKALEIVDSTDIFLQKENPTVKEMRSGLPKAVQVLYHLEPTLRGTNKIKNIWAPENKPNDWEEGVIFEDPNNGQKKKTEKLKKPELYKMFVHLKKNYPDLRPTIMEQKDAHRKNQPTLPAANTPQEACMEILYQRTTCLSEECLGNNETVRKVKNCTDKLLAQAQEGERRRLIFGKFCSKVQEYLTDAILRAHLDMDDLIKNLVNLVEQYQSLDSVQAVSEDMGTLYTNKLQKAQISVSAMEYCFEDQKESQLLPDLLELQGQPLQVQPELSQPELSQLGLSLLSQPQLSQPQLSQPQLSQQQPSQLPGLQNIKQVVHNQQSQNQQQGQFQPTISNQYAVHLTPQHQDGMVPLPSQEYCFLNAQQNITNQPINFPLKSDEDQRHQDYLNVNQWCEDQQQNTAPSSEMMAFALDKSQPTVNLDYSPQNMFGNTQQPYSPEYFTQTVTSSTIDVQRSRLGKRTYDETTDITSLPDEKKYTALEPIAPSTDLMTTNLTLDALNLPYPIPQQQGSFRMFLTEGTDQTMAIHVQVNPEDISMDVDL